jgi:moderate conductance mechanosensitive channel
MSASPSVFAAVDNLSAAAADLFSHEWWQENAETLVAKPLRILLVVVLAAVVRLLVNRGIRRLTERTASGEVPSVLRPWRRRGRPADPVGV